jgi:hypothetical protein
MASFGSSPLLTEVLMLHLQGADLRIRCRS